MAGGRRAGRGFLLRPARPATFGPTGVFRPKASVTTKLPLKWSFAIVTTIPTTTVLTDDEDAWSVPLEWTFMIDVDPPDDVEDGYTYDVFTATFLEVF